METNKKCSCGLKPIATIEENKRAWADNKCSSCYEIGKFYELRQLQCLREEIAYLRGIVDAARILPADMYQMMELIGGDMDERSHVEVLVSAFANYEKWEEKRFC